MADDVDKSQEHIDKVVETATYKAAKAVGQIPKGEPGICKICGWDAPRLVKGLCSPCRDRKRLP